MKEPKIFCDCNSDWEIDFTEGINPHQLTGTDLRSGSLGKCTACGMYRWHDAYYENEQFDKEEQP